MAGIPAPAQKDPFPIYTLLMNAGLSPADVRRCGDAILKAMYERLKRKALSDNADERALYKNDRAHRVKVNQEIVRECIAELRFSEPELAKLDAGLRLGLIAPRPKGPLIAHATHPS